MADHTAAKIMEQVFGLPEDKRSPGYRQLHASALSDFSSRLKKYHEAWDSFQTLLVAWEAGGREGEMPDMPEPLWEAAAAEAPPLRDWGELGPYDADDESEADRLAAVTSPTLLVEDSRTWEFCTRLITGDVYRQRTSKYFFMKQMCEKYHWVPKLYTSDEFSALLDAEHAARSV